MLCGAGGRDVGGLGQFLGPVLPVVDEGAVDQDAVDDAELRGPGGVEGEADRPAALLDVGLADQPLGLRVRGVVDAGDLVAVVDPALVGGVRGHRAVPVEVVGRQVEHGGGVRADAGRPVQLVAGEFDGEDVVGPLLGRRGPTSSRETPMLPTAAVRRPAAARIAASIRVVVVLPLVPVTASQGAGVRGPRSRQASSTSPQTSHARRGGGREQRAVGLPAGGGDDEFGAGRAAWSRRRRGAR